MSESRGWLPTDEQSCKSGLLAHTETGLLAAINELYGVEFLARMNGRDLREAINARLAVLRKQLRKHYEQHGWSE